MKRVLITGFQPFGGESINPSFEAIKAIDRRKLNCELYTLELPVAFYDASRIAITKINEIEPDIIIMVGQAGGRKEISIERVAINLDDTLLPDNKGVAPLDDSISLFGPTAYFSTLPAKQICDALSRHHIPSGLSYSAGTYVCNHLFYSVLHELSVSKREHVLAGFIHVPYETTQTELKPHLFSLERGIITQALTLAIDITLQKENL